MSHSAKIKNSNTGEIGKELVKALEAKELDEGFEYVCAGRVAGKPCLACFGSKPCRRETKSRINAYFSARKGGGEHVNGCIFDKSNKDSIWKGVPTENAELVDLEKIVEALEKSSGKDENSSRKQKTKKDLVPKKEVLLAFVPSEYKEAGTNQLKESYDITTEWIDGKLSTVLLDKEKEEQVWDRTITREEIKEATEEVKKESTGKKKIVTRKYDQINKNLFQIYLLAITSDENTKFLGYKKTAECCLNCMTYRNFRTGRSELNGIGLFVGRTFNFTHDWILDSVENLCKTRNINHKILLNDAFVPKEFSTGDNKRAEDLPVVAILDCDGDSIREKVLKKIRSGLYHAILCRWETVTITATDGNLRRIVIGSIRGEKQVEPLKGEANLEDKNSLA